MFINFQFSFFDLRRLINNESYFFNPNLKHLRNLNCPFYRQFGPVMNRYHSESLRINEMKYVQSKNAVKFNDKFNELKMINVFERLFIDDYNCHFDIGVKTMAKVTFNYKDILKTIEKLITSPIISNENKNINLSQLSMAVEEKYIKATTYKRDVMSTKEYYHYIIDNPDPIVFVEYTPGEIINFSESVQVFQVNKDIVLRYNTQEINGRKINLWFIEKNNGSVKVRLRELRIALSNIYHNRACLQLFLLWLRSNENEVLKKFNCSEDIYIDSTEYYFDLMEEINKITEEDEAADFDMYMKALEVNNSLHLQSWRDVKALIQCERRKNNRRITKKRFGGENMNNNGIILDKSIVIGDIIIGDKSVKLTNENDEICDFERAIENLKKDLAEQEKEQLQKLVEDFTEMLKEQNTNKSETVSKFTLVKNMLEKLETAGAAAICGKLIEMGQALINRI